MHSYVKLYFIENFLKVNTVISIKSVEWQFILLLILLPDLLCKIQHKIYFMVYTQYFSISLTTFTSSCVLLLTD